MDFIEGGWPGSNPKDAAFFERMKSAPLKNAKLAAFGSTCRPGVAAAADTQIQMLLAASTPVITIFGKSWEQHIRFALRTSPDENLRMIEDSVCCLKSRGALVVYDAEHFFDGYKSNSEYAINCLEAAIAGGAERIVLCDTNGGTLPNEVAGIVASVNIRLDGALIGIHTHNDSECAVANSLEAVANGAMHVQGTVNGYGERCGNCNLVPVAANLRLKMGYDCLLPDSLIHLTALAQYVDEIANLSPDTRRPYVGKSAFAHKGGVHADAVLKGASYEHIDPELVGNSRRLLVSELAGGSSIAGKAAEYGFDLNKKSPETHALLKAVTEREHEGYSYEGAEASFELLILRQSPLFRNPFNLAGFRCIVEQRGGEPITEATVKVEIAGIERLTVAEGDGPVHALDGALRKALIDSFPELAEIKLTDFKVRVVNTREGTAAKVRVIIDSSDGDQSWSTVGVSTNMIEASCHALIDSIVFGLVRCEHR
jgi:2-isopropylmalate synthase